MAATYRDPVGALIRSSLSEHGGMEEAKEALRGLIDRIVLAPDVRGQGLTIDLHGALANRHGARQHAAGPAPGAEAWHLIRVFLELMGGTPETWRQREIPLT